MKRTLVLLVFAFLTFFSSNAQGVEVGVTGGLLNANVEFRTGNSILNLVGVNRFAKINNTGYYAGILVDIAATEKFHVQPELTYGRAGDLSFVYLPIMAKYYVADKFHVQAGPQLNFSSNLNDIKQTIQDVEEIIGTNGNVDDVLKTLGVDLGFGAGYDITDKLGVQARYAFELTDRYSGPAGSLLNIKGSNLNLGAYYKF
ncbi:porin family protein [Maribacter halichondriae]|uniref:porin family protein n=1 Tax=Maribacter halichondriae TaxID=2980554 RepID=UPI0023592E3C|nr:porin family protein [Maribacter sp. Hal144]